MRVVRTSVLRSPTYGDVGDHKVLFPARRARGTGGSFLGARVRVGSGVEKVTVGTRSSSAPPLEGDAARPLRAGVLACDVKCPGGNDLGRGGDVSTVRKA